MAGPDEPQLPTWLTKLVGGSKSSAGIVAVLAGVAATAFVAIAAAAYNLPHDWTRLVAILFIGALLWYFVERMIKFAVGNPEAASTSGKEFLEAMKSRLELKGSNNPEALPPPEANVAPPQIVAQPAKPEENQNG